MTPATPERAALAAEQVRTSNVLVDAARLESVLTSLVEAEGLCRTLARVERALQALVDRRGKGCAR